MLSQEVQVAIELAQHEALDRRNTVCSLEHLLYALTHDPETADVLKQSGGNVESLKHELDEHLDGIESISEDEELSISYSLAFERAIQRAMIHVQSSRMDVVQGFNIIIAMFAEPDCYATYFLENNDVTRLDLVNFVSHGVSKVGDGTHGFEVPSGGVDDDESAPKSNPLDAFCSNLNAVAAEGRIDPLIGRMKEINRCVHILARRRKNNPILVGDSGVGKTAIIEGLARKIHEGDVPDSIKDAVIYSLDMGSMLAGTKFRGDFEERMKGILKALKEIPHSVLFIDEIHTIIGAGETMGGTMDASNMLKPALQSGELRCIGSTTYEEFRKYFERDRALARRFQRVEVLEPSIGETIKILAGLKPHYESFHGVHYTNGSLEAAAELSARHLKEQRLPDKAIDLIDEAGATIKLLPASKKRKTVNQKDIERVLSTMARIPEKHVNRNDKEALRHLSRDLKRVIFGQDAAVEQLSTAVKLARAGIGNENQPVGSFIFTGPTGVGKTELARQLAFLLGIELVRFDMSEYMERHTVSRLIGAPPGYVGFEQGGLLTEAVSKTPHCVVLLDEIEKAHPDVFNILLQIMDHGALTDNNGRTADFTNAILIMTSNVGARDIAKGQLGFGGGSDGGGDDTAAYKRCFNPEFRNRLDAKISFVALLPEVMRRIVDKFVTELE
jgi:ATP-dependent Clp protease ATP-binding subunit ClpA